MYFASLYITEEEAKFAENFLQQSNLYAFYMEYTKNDVALNPNSFKSQKISDEATLKEISTRQLWGYDTFTSTSYVTPHRPV